MSEAPQGNVVASGGSWWGSMKAVGWSFFGVRKGSDHEHDLARLNPIHVIVVAFVAVLFFVASLVAVVNWVVAR